MIEGREAELHGYDSIRHYVLYTIEEFLEMIAIVALIYALLLYIEQQFGRIHITLRIKAIKDGSSPFSNPGNRSKAPDGNKGVT